MSTFWKFQYYVKCIQCIFERNIKIRSSGAIWIQMIQHITWFLHWNLFITSFSPTNHLSHVYKHKVVASCLEICNVVLIWFHNCRYPFGQRIGWLWFLPLLSNPLLNGGRFVVFGRKLGQQVELLYHLYMFRSKKEISISQKDSRPR